MGMSEYLETGRECEAAGQIGAGMAIRAGDVEMCRTKFIPNGTQSHAFHQTNKLGNKRYK